MTPGEYSRAVIAEMEQLFVLQGGLVPRSLGAPFIDLMVYYRGGLTPRQAARCYLGLATMTRMSSFTN